MKKKLIIYYLWWLLAFPCIAVCLCTAISSFLTLNYEYLPKETDFLNNLFYELSYTLLDVTLCFCIGVFCYALYKRKALQALCAALISLFSAGVVPMIMFFVRSVFLASVSGSQIMEEYFSYDVYASEANILRTLAALLIALIVMSVFFFGNVKKPFAKPYIAPKSEPAVSALVMSIAYLSFSVFAFALGGDYDVIPLIMQIVASAASYFIIIYGAYCTARKLGTEM